MVKVAAKFVNLLKKVGVFVMIWVTESIILITILIVIPLVLFTLLNVRSVVNSILEAQSRRLENVLITTKEVCLGMEGVRGEYRGSIIDKTDISKPAEREGFRVYKLDSFVPAL